ncbi:MAG TPA: ATP-binding protein [Prolixibacteraceae bacterium]|nr:ATP-binding protein [Prolixibacteraceae bacterium]
MRIWLFVFLVIASITNSWGIEVPVKTKNILVINSYHQGYSWTDSMTVGIIQEFRKHPEITLYIESLNSKQFGQTFFELTKQYFQNKYASKHFDGVLVTDNDALNFAFQYDQDLFPNVPVVFAGISNPEDYPLENSQYYGLKETSNSNLALGFVQKILPEAKRLLVLTDFTTTGLIYRKELTEEAARLDDFSVVFPEVIDEDSIFRMASSGKACDAIFYIGINQDENGQLVDFMSFLDKVIQVSKVPVFNNDPFFMGRGVVGGLYQSGKKHGSVAAGLLVQLMDSTVQKPAKRFNTTGNDFYFDRKLLDKYQIPVSRIPEGSLVINNPSFPNKEYFIVLIGALAVLIFIVFHLYYTNRKAKEAERKIRKQFNQIHNQNKELEEAYGQLSGVISELEKTNIHLKRINIDMAEAKKKAEESDNLKSAFLANVSHEIRTPLNSIVGFSSLLSEDDLSLETRNSYIELIESNTESLLVLIDEIIDLSKIEAQQLIIKKQNFSINSLMEELFHIFNQGHKNPKVELRMSKISDASELFVYSDRIRVKQVFINLLSNALKFTESGFIEFGYLEAGNHKIQLYVRDSGIGISEEYHELVFERFRKLNNEGNKFYRGTGLGLSITKKLVELLGGKIWIESEPGKGTVFFYTLEGLELKDSPS